MMPFKGMLPGVVALYVCAALLGIPSYAADDDAFDIVGLKLGMDSAEVKQALADHGIDASAIEEAYQSYVYSDGVRNDYRTSDFLSRISASKRTEGNQNHDYFTIYFAPPPEGGYVVGISRDVGSKVNPPTTGQYREALHAKYGPPTVPHKNANIDQWLFESGTMNCLEGSLNAQTTMPVKNTRGGDNTLILEKVFYTSGGSFLIDRFRNGRVKDLTECAHILQYSIAGIGLGSDRAFTTANAILIDVQSWVRAELAAGAMVENLRQESVKKREAKGAKPVL